MNKDIKHFLTKNSSTIMTITSCLGFIFSIGLSIYETPKAIEKIKEKEKEKGEKLTKKEKIKTAVPVYIPMISTSALTLGCIIGSEVLNKNNQRSLIGSMALVEKGYSAYKSKVKEICGEETHQKIMEEIQKDKVKRDDVSIYVTSGFEDFCGSFEEEDLNKECLFWDEYSNTYFDAYPAQVCLAFYHLNRNFRINGYACVNELYDFLGIKEIKKMDDKFWNASKMFEEKEGFDWIDYKITKTTVDDDLRIYTIELIDIPEYDEEFA